MKEDKKMKFCYDLLNDWNLTRQDGLWAFSYPEEGDFYGYGFVQKHSGSADLMDFKGIFITANVEVAEVMKITIGFVDGKEISCDIPVAEGAARSIKVSFRDFPLETSKETAWKYVDKLTINTCAEIISCQMRKREHVYADFSVRGRAGDLNEAVTYEGRVYNCSDEPITVSVAQLYEGWESMSAELQWEKSEQAEAIVLQAGREQIADSPFLCT